VIVLFIYLLFICFWLFGWVVIAGQPLLRTQEKFCLHCWSIPTFFSGNSGAKFRKKFKKFPETIDSVARGRASSLAGAARLREVFLRSLGRARRAFR